jgi:hypothetical protein
MAKANSKSALPGHEHLTMGDQLRASRISAKETTSPTTGAVTNPRREHLKNQIQARANRWAEKQRRDAGE